MQSTHSSSSSTCIFFFSVRNQSKILLTWFIGCDRFLLHQQLVCEKQEKEKLQLCDITSLSELEEWIDSTKKPSQKAGSQRRGRQHQRRLNSDLIQGNVVPNISQNLRKKRNNQHWPEHLTMLWKTTAQLETHKFVLQQTPDNHTWEEGEEE